MHLRPGVGTGSRNRIRTKVICTVPEQNRYFKSKETTLKNRKPVNNVI
jgi:hypothetical protein